jgi:hypothetical protein
MGIGIPYTTARKQEHTQTRERSSFPTILPNHGEKNFHYSDNVEIPLFRELYRIYFAQKQVFFTSKFLREDF